MTDSITFNESSLQQQTETNDETPIIIIIPPPPPAHSAATRKDHRVNQNKQHSKAARTKLEEQCFTWHTLRISDWIQLIQCLHQFTYLYALFEGEIDFVVYAASVSKRVVYIQHKLTRDNTQDVTITFEQFLDFYHKTVFYVLVPVLPELVLDIETKLV